MMSFFFKKKKFKAPFILSGESTFGILDVARALGKTL